MADYYMQAPGILDYPHLFKPGRGGKYEATILIEDKEETARIMAAIKEAIKDGVTTGGKDANGNPTPAPFAGYDPDDKTFLSRLILPLKNGDTDVFQRGAHKGELRKSVNPEFAGRFFVKATRKDSPAGANRLLDLSNGERDSHPQAGAFRSGDLVCGAFWFRPYSKDGDMGVQAYLTSLVKVKSGTLKTVTGETVYEPGDTDPFAGFNLPGMTDGAASDPFAGFGLDN